MSARVAAIWRHPIKAHGREEVAEATLAPGACLPGDRTWAVAHEGSAFDPAAPAWTPCGQFQRAARTQALMAITARWDEAAGVLRLDHPDLGPLAFDPETEGARFLDWVRPISPDGAFAPKALVRAPGRGMTDSDYPSISIKSLASNADLGRAMGMDLSMHRWRGNLWIEGLEPWEEESWPGRRLRIGEAVLEVRERVGRCKATEADPETGLPSGDTRRALRALRGAETFGVYAVVAEGGAVRTGDPVEVF